MKLKRRMHVCTVCIHRISIPVFPGGDGGGFITSLSNTHTRIPKYRSALSPDAHKIIILVKNKQRRKHTEEEWERQSF